MIFECTFTYMAPNPNSTNGNYKKFVDVIAVQAENYMDAETMATGYGMFNIDADFAISPIKEVVIDSVQRNDKHGGRWYKCTGVYSEATISGKIRQYKMVVLQQHEDFIKSSTKALEYMQNLVGECRLIKVEETPIIEYVEKD